MKPSGCPLPELVNEIRGRAYLQAAHPRTAGEVLSGQAVATIWGWIVARNDISVGVNREHNNLSLEDALTLSARLSRPAEIANTISHAPDAQAGLRDDATATNSLTESRRNENHEGIRVFASEDTLWEAITGHSQNYKRVPRSEWLLLLGIASTKAEGILQGDLGRLVDQDKRSVPKRTDALVKKGYIVKRTTLVRGTKTSKLWLKTFTPPLPKEADEAEPAKDIEMNLSHHLLTADLDPVPWQGRWTNESIDFAALATTIMAVAKEWRVIRIQDLKAKLGVLGMRWQMKTVSKICRFLNSCQAIQYVAAKLEDKLFKDCIQFKKDLTTKDWSNFLATGKRGKAHSTRRIPRGTYGAEPDLPNDCTEIGAARLGTSMPWSVDMPLPYFIAKSAQTFATDGLTNPEIYALALGSSYNRYISSMTASMAASRTQPTHLRHFQLKSAHMRSGKVASYRYSTILSSPSAATTLPSHVVDNGADGLKRLNLLAWHRQGFQPDTIVPRYAEEATSLSQVCGLQSSGLDSHRGNRRRGRPRKMIAQHKEQAIAPIMENPASAEMEDESKHSATLAQVHAGSLGQTSHGWDRVQTPSSTMRQGSPRQGMTLSAPTTRRTDISMASTSKATGRAIDGQDKKNARGKGRGRGRGRPPQELSDGTPSGKPWVCEKCGGAWKNDIGLKYHLEKSKTACNPQFTIGRDDSSPKGRKPKFCKASEDIANSENDNTAEQYKSKHTSFEKHIRHESLSDSPVAVELVEDESATRQTGRKSSPLKSWKRSTVTQSFATTSSSHSITLSTGRNLLLARRARPTHEVRSSGSSVMLSSTGTKRTVADTQVASAEIIRAQMSPVLSAKSRPEQLALVEGNSSTAENKHERHLAGYRNDTLRGFVVSMIRRKNGAAPRDDAFCNAIMDTWSQQHPEEEPLDRTQCEAVINSLVKDGQLSEHHHALRASSASFVKCQILTLPDVDGLSTESIQILQRYKASLPVTKQSTQSPSSPPKPLILTPSGRRRRLLAEEVAVLHAPVYAAQVAAKHSSDGPLDSKKRVKRRRVANEGAMSAQRRKGWETPENASNWPQLGSDNIRDASAQVDVANPVIFLEPTTYSGRQPPQYLSLAQSRLRSPARHSPNKETYLHIADGLSPSVQCGVRFSALETVHGRNGVWPKLDAQHFEQRDCSATMAGWVPNSQWFRWSDFGISVQRRHRTLESKLRSQHGNHLSPRQRFLTSLQAFVQVEEEWALLFIEGSNGTAGPHNIFLRLSGPALATNFPVTSALTWPADGCLTPAAYLARADNNADSTSSEDELLPSNSQSAAGYCKAIFQSSMRQSSKSVPYASRILIPLRNNPSSVNQKYHPSPEDSPEVLFSDSEEELMAAFVALRALMGGTDRAIDWGLLQEIFPNMTILQLRKFWIDARKQQGPYISTFTKAFQDSFITGCENNEIAMVNFDKPLEYNWAGLIRWTMQIAQKDGFHLPESRSELDGRFTLKACKETSEDWRETFFHVQSSIFSRFEAVTAYAGAYVATNAAGDQVSAQITSEVDIAKSWIKSLCSMGDGKYSVEEIRDRLVAISNGSKQQASQLLKRAIDQLTRQRVICRSKKPPFGGRPYRLNESYLNSLAKVCQSGKYIQAAAFKERLDSCFRRQDSWEISYAITDGEMMALMNLSAAGRIRLLPQDLPNMPFGFEPGNYESRKYPKSYYHFPVMAVPTESYQYNEQIGLLLTAKETLPPSAGPCGELPQWVDIFGEHNFGRWAEILGATCFAYATRGSMDTLGLCRALSPILDEFEAHLILEWGRETGVFTGITEDLGINVCEWWWLVVPHLQMM